MKLRSESLLLLRQRADGDVLVSFAGFLQDSTQLRQCNLHVGLRDELPIPSRRVLAIKYCQACRATACREVLRNLVPRRQRSMTVLHLMRWPATPWSSASVPRRRSSAKALSKSRCRSFHGELCHPKPGGEDLELASQLCATQAKQTCSDVSSTLRLRERACAACAHKCSFMHATFKMNGVHRFTQASALSAKRQSAR